jgi:hypothetical protein
MKQFQTQLEQIIERSRREEEAFLVDSKTAAENIIKFLIEKGFGEVEGK